MSTGKGGSTATTGLIVLTNFGLGSSAHGVIKVVPCVPACSRAADTKGRGACTNSSSFGLADMFLPCNPSVEYV